MLLLTIYIADYCCYPVHVFNMVEEIFIFLIYLFIIFFNKGKQSKLMASKLLNKKQHKVHQTIKTFYTPLNLKLTLSSMFKQMHVRTKDKSLN